MLKSISISSVAWLLICVGTFAQQDKYPGGIVYGPKAAFNLSAPEGWVLDNNAGAAQGLPCVLYPKESSWADAKTIIYAKIASPNFTNAEAFAAHAIKEMQKTHGTSKQKVASGKTGDGHHYFVNEYPATKRYSQWERVAYVQLPGAVAYIVLSSRNEASYRKDNHALQDALKSFAYLKVGGDQH